MNICLKIKSEAHQHFQTFVYFTDCEPLQQALLADDIMAR